MAKYKFIKNFTARVTVGGAKGLENKSSAVGDVYEGKPKGDFVKIRIAPHSSINDGNVGSAMYQETLDVPKEYLRSNLPLYIGLGVGALLIGYFAYKKFKK